MVQGRFWGILSQAQRAERNGWSELVLPCTGSLTKSLTGPALLQLLRVCQSDSFLSIRSAVQMGMSKRREGAS
eukprot:4341606-Amphidinium_carterae.1